MQKSTLPIIDLKNENCDISVQEKDKFSSMCIFLVAGRLIYRKGHMFLFDALERIPTELSFQCRIVGDGPDLKKLKKRIADSPISNKVVFTGKIPFVEMEQEYNKADVFVMPSLRETSGSVLLESMSKGLPVVTINKYGAATLLNENTGWLYDGDTKETYISNLADTLVECILKPNEVKRKGINARAEAHKYTWEEKNKHYTQIYKRII